MSHSLGRSRTFLPFPYTFGRSRPGTLCRACTRVFVSSRLFPPSEGAQFPRLSCFCFRNGSKSRDSVPLRRPCFAASLVTAPVNGIAFLVVALSPRHSFGRSHVGQSFRRHSVKNIEQAEVFVIKGSNKHDSCYVWPDGHIYCSASAEQIYLLCARLLRIFVADNRIEYMTRKKRPSSRPRGKHGKNQTPDQKAMFPSAWKAREESDA